MRVIFVRSMKLVFPDRTQYTKGRYCGTKILVISFADLKIYIKK